MPIEFLNQNILLVSIVVVSGLGLLWPMLVRRAGQAVNPGAATLLINRENAVVVDVRESDEFAQGHLPDAVSLPLSKFAERIAELDKYKDQPVIVCCASGVRSNNACRQLATRGFARLSNLEGGVDAWVAAGYPLKKGGKGK